MYQDILVPVDFTERNREAVRVAGRLATPGAGRVTLLHVVQTIPLVDSAGMNTFYSDLVEASHAKLAELGELLDDQRVRWESRSVVGSRAAEIVEAASGGSTDLVVLSSHPLELDGETPGDGWATLSYQVAIMAPCPVLLVK